MLDLKNIEAIIFDLGNVIVDIDYEVMVAAFKKISPHDFSQIISYARQDNIFDQFEKGQISVEAFRLALRKYLHADISDEAIDEAWNAILIHYPPAKLNLLKKLRSKYKLYALSNINELHLGAIDRHVRSNYGVSDMSEYFDRAYYSHEMGQRKPDAEIYQTLIEKENLDPARTLFIDDKSENTEAAASLGIQVYHLQDRDTLVGLFEA